MRVRYSFSSRRTRRTKNMRKQKQKYPALLSKVLEVSDIILQVLDSRFVKDTRNLDFEKEIKKEGKKIIYVLNKSDLTDKIPKLGNSVLVSCKTRKGVRDLRDKIKFEAKKIDKDKIVVGVVGYPNTGKSSLINLLIGKSSAGIGSDAGFTKGLQKLKLTSDIVLLDSPGVIPEAKYSNIKEDKIAQHTKVGGRSYSQVKDPEMVIANLMKEFGRVIEKHYKINSKGNAEVLLDKLGKKFNYLKKGGEVNMDKTARRILKDFQRGEIRV